MALSMDEQRMLAEIERRLAAEDPGLATRLSSFRRPGRAAALRTPRGRIIGSLCTVVLLAVIGLTVYAMIPFRAPTSKTLINSPKTRPTATAPVRSGTVRSGPNSETTASAKASTSTTASTGTTVANSAVTGDGAG
jgi:cytoskeletal protein RodZ